MTELRFPVKDKAIKPLRKMLKRHGLKLVEVRRYAVVRREDDGEELCGGTCDEVSKWVARKMREDWLEP